MLNVDSKRSRETKSGRSYQGGNVYFCLANLCPAIGFVTILMKARHEELIIVEKMDAALNFEYLGSPANGKKKRRYASK